MILLVAITVAVAALAVLATIVVVAVGGGGELSTEHPDHPPLALPGRRPLAGTDAALLRLPLGLWGYHKQITDEALERFAYELTERDTRIAVLEQELAEARQGHGGGARAARPALPQGPGDPLATRADRAFGTPAGSGDPLATRTDRPPAAPVTREEALPASRPPAAVPLEATAAEPRDKTAEPGEKTAEPEDNAAEPAEKADEPVTRTQEPADAVEDPRPAREDGAG